MTQDRPWYALLIFISLSSYLVWISGCTAPPRTKTIQHIEAWEELTNPILKLSDSRITDIDAIYDRGVWYLFYSVAYEDTSGKYSQIIEVSTTDFKNFSEPILSFTGQEDGWLGMANPDITRHRNLFYLTFNSLGHLAGKPNQLFYMTSRDLKTWTAKTPLAMNVTVNEMAAQPSLAFDRGKSFLLYTVGKQPHVAMAKALRTPFERLGIGTPTFYTSTDTVVTHTQHQFIRFGNKWGLLASGSDVEPYLYRLPTQGTSGLGWLTWEGGYPLKVFRREVASVPAPKSAALVNMKRFGGYFYLFYVIQSATETTQDRGSSNIEVYRSKDLINWAPAGS